ncbi:PAS domain S-box-containing protein [Nitrosospira multiformis]|jgi:PAS domain S-box-containing protein|uniref:PAS domain S-box-containing protein n=1 Tax=Nitrosospira multiformis TaxID=1231 RepID=A0A2T5I0Z0_9PROT|nr:PAS domain-containing protein [Nitrosospira multiformis]PTQ77494.1 PAS domain S-box-containing protein [Nitrosospira multiformis]
MFFMDDKDPGLIPRTLCAILDSCVNGVTLADPDLEDLPLVYANNAFAVMTGYTQEETIGKNCRFLQGTDQKQEEKGLIRNAIKNAQPIEVTLRNYRKTGELFYNRLAITPLFDSEGRVLYYLGVQYDVTKQVLAEKEIERLKAHIESLTK